MTTSAVKVSEDKKVAYYKNLNDLKLVPFWDVRAKLVAFEPGTPCQSHIWRFADVRHNVTLMDTYIDVKAAERRSLILENPGLPGTAQVTKSLYASLQFVSPGEVEDYIATLRRPSASSSRGLALTRQSPVGILCRPATWC